MWAPAWLSLSASLVRITLALHHLYCVFPYWKITIIRQNLIFQRSGGSLLSLESEMGGVFWADISIQALRYNWNGAFGCRQVVRALSAAAAACMHVRRRHLILMACRKFGVTTPDIKARERERKREQAHWGKSPHERYWFKDISSFSTYFSTETLSTSYCAFIVCWLSEGLWQPAWL